MTDTTASATPTDTAPTDTTQPTDTAQPAGDSGAPRRRPALSPSRAGDFKQCPLLYRFRAIDRIPEPPTKAQVRGTLVHSVLERLFALPRGDRSPERAHELLAPTWEELSQQSPEWAELFAEDETGPDGHAAGWLDGAGKLLDAYFGLEDPNRLEPEACELHVETELGSGVRLRGYVDRLDVAPTGEIRVVDYKTGAAPRAIGEAKALFQMKFYAVVLWRTRGVVPRQLKLMYLRDGQDLAYTPDEDELARFERTLEAIWSAILAAGRTGDFRPSPSKLCDWCAHQSLCPAFGGTPPEYPGWPEPTGGEESALDRAD
ncbi:MULTISPECIES: RecB family exonuclease [Prauserella salsuginis group]|uniref:RecB family exonuclease n=1 Tax=Prauserella salsuginis TaxID=387889 RepID=A0ABW6G4F1_9PSEU|nr:MULTISPECIES: RecB family exonuclease [Prauserella salsuginis group]MCR3718225.1 putative RecB family exonuclease [Prauserella flava]MCR3732795.1 putative RecB family exonuclease [Prauserella salsuginis]